MNCLIIKSDGKVYVNEFPEEPKCFKEPTTLRNTCNIICEGNCSCVQYQKAYDHALSTAIECADQGKAIILLSAHHQSQEHNHPYPILGMTFTKRLHCDQYHYHDRPSCFSADLHYSEPGEEQLFDSLKSQKDFREKVREILKSEPVINGELCPTCHKAKDNNPWCSNAFHITRKNKI